MLGKIDVFKKTTEIILGSNRLVTGLIFVAFVFGLNGKQTVYRAFYNVDTISVIKLFYQGDTQLVGLPEQFGKRFPVYQELFPCAAEGLYTWHAIQSNQMERAVASFSRTPCIQARFAFPEMSWKDSNYLLTGGNRGWSNQRQIAVYGMFLNARHEQRAGNLEDSLNWFHKGLVSAPGRVPDYVRKNYYTLLADWYALQTENEQAQRLSVKASCLVDDDLSCLNSDNLMDWPLSFDELFMSDDGWQLMALKIDREILAMGLDVQGWWLWQREVHGQVEQIGEDFLIPNLAPNAGFEIDALFEDNCVSGYVSSHLYVFPCVSYIASDPYNLSSDRVAIIETQNKGFALTSATFPVQANRSYLVGGHLCADGGADALVGRDLINITSDGKLEPVSVTWFFSQKTDASTTACWQQHLFFVERSADVEEFRLRLQREGLSTETVGRAMFEDLFFFEMPSIEKSR
jgi:hypothetical protein